MLKRLKNSIFIIVIAAMMIGCVDQSGKTSSNQELKIAATSVAVTEILKELDVPASQVVGIPTTEAYSIPKRYKKATELGTATVSYTHLDVYKRQPPGIGTSLPTI